MANRHLSRSIVLQTLFEWDFTGKEVAKLSDILKRNIEEFGPGLTDSSFMENLLETVVNKLETVDGIIVKSAPDWPLDRISTVDRNVLRIGLAELLFGDKKEVPSRVAINEAIELAKTFGGENSGKFVNGVLGTVYKELGEPENEIVPPKRKGKEPIDLSKLPIEKLGGAVVYAKEGNTIYLAFVHDVFGFWTLAKGKIDASTPEEEGVAGKILEEIGIKVKVGENIGRNEYVASDPEKGKIRKQVSYFIAEAQKEDLKLKETGGLDDAKWFEIDDIVDLKMYNDIVPIITKSIEIITSGN
ncbi:MAG: transcription antitermination factor NusB [Candidatus Vogelbacteria bacterium]|nr:transcription antitermination factor NusB [Candidatus Vogelbacteria bacterium]